MPSLKRPLPTTLPNYPKFGEELGFDIDLNLNKHTYNVLNGLKSNIHDIALFTGCVFVIIITLVLNVHV